VTRSSSQPLDRLGRSTQNMLDFAQGLRDRGAKVGMDVGARLQLPERYPHG
jgi:hypothetical protein